MFNYFVGYMIPDIKNDWWRKYTWKHHKKSTWIFLSCKGLSIVFYVKKKYFWCKMEKIGWHNIIAQKTQDSMKINMILWIISPLFRIIMCRTIMWNICLKPSCNKKKRFPCSLNFKGRGMELDSCPSSDTCQGISQSLWKRGIKHQVHFSETNKQKKWSPCIDFHNIHFHELLEVLSYWLTNVSFPDLTEP